MAAHGWNDSTSSGRVLAAASAASAASPAESSILLDANMIELIPEFEADKKLRRANAVCSLLLRTTSVRDNA